jgi:hypothetical protein
VHSPTLSCPSNVSFGSIISNGNTPFFSPIQSTSSTTTTCSPSVFTSSTSLRCLLQPSCHTSPSVVSPTSNNTPTNISQQLVNVSPSTQIEQSDIEIVANTLFQNTVKELYNDAEFLQVLREWYNEDEEDRTDHHEANLKSSLKRKRE